jgi:S-adenosylmethionine hydrolase
VNTITLTTDFGNGSPYVAAMKGVILSINPSANVVDLSHEVPAQDIRQGAIVLDDVTGWFPKDTVHVAVVDPGVGTERAIVYARIGEHDFVVPDNGLLSRLVTRTPPKKIIRLTNPEYWLDPVSATFHGRDIMAPVAAHLSLGLNPELLGKPVDRLEGLHWPEVRQTPTKIEGQILRIDSFGNLVTNITAEMLVGRPTDERVCIVCNIYETWGIFHTYAEHPHGTFVALVGSTGHLELAVVGDNAAEMLGIEAGMPVVVAWE